MILRESQGIGWLIAKARKQSEAFRVILLVLEFKIVFFLREE